MQRNGAYQKTEKRQITGIPLVLRQPWNKVFRDFDPRTGNYLIFGLIGLVFWPYVVMQIS